MRKLNPQLTNVNTRIINSPDYLTDRHSYAGGSHPYGIWAGTSIWYGKTEGYRDNTPIKFNINMQKGPALEGIKEYMGGDGKIYYENFIGIITLTGEVYESDHGVGFGIGR